MNKPRMKFCTRCGKLIPAIEECSCEKEAARARNRSRNEMNPEEKKFFNSTRWKKLRKKIIERDGAVCQRCLIKYNVIITDNIQVHHIKPRVKYPELRYTESNLVTLCRSCNTGLGIKEELDFKWDIRDDWVPVL